MVRRIFDNDNVSSPSTTVIDLMMEGFSHFAVLPYEQQVIEHNGHMWRRERRLVKTFSTGECFLMFFTVLFKKMLVVNANQIEDIREEWEAVFSGRMVIFIYRPVVNSAESVNHVAARVNMHNPAGSDLRAFRADLAWNTTSSVPQVAPLTAREEELQSQAQEHATRYRSLMGSVLAKLRQWLAPVNALVRPVLVPLERSYAIQIPTAAHLTRFSQPLCQCLADKLQQAAIPFEQISVQNGAKVEYRIDIAHMPAFLAALPELGLDADDENAAREEFISYGNASFVQHAPSALREDIEKAIALTLAHTSPALRAVLAEVEEGASISHLIPHISIDFSGMTIRIPEGQDLLSSLLQAVHGLHIELEDSIMDSRNYAYKVHIPRDEIKALLDKIGLQAMPASNEGDTYYSALVKPGHIHAYTPVLAINPYEALNQSLSKLVPNVHLHAETFQEEPLMPYTAMHPKGWLCIRLPKLAEIAGGQAALQQDDHFAKGLQQYLNLAEPYAIDFTTNDTTYDREHRIDPRDLPAFLKKIGLEKDLEDRPFIDKLALPAGIRQPQQAIDSRNISEAIAKRLVSFLQGHANINAWYASEGWQLELAIRGERIEISIPLILCQERIEIYPGQRMSFGRYLAHTFGLSLTNEQTRHRLSPPISNNYQLSIPLKDVRSFLEKDLALRDLPINQQTGGLRTYYDLFVNDRRLFGWPQQVNHLAIIDWSLRNPTLPLPRNIPQLTAAEIVQRAEVLLNGHPAKDQYCRVIRETLEGARQLASGTAEMLHKYLTMMVVPIEGLHLTGEQCRAALISIGATATACMPGRFTKVQQEFKYMVSPEARDQVKSLLLEKIELFKDGLLAEIFRDASDCMHVHCVAAAQVTWGAELGLDAAAGGRDTNLRYGMDYVNEAKKRQFKDLCQQNLATHLFDELSEAHDEDTGGLLHAELYRERLVRILQAKGYLLQEIEGQDEHPISANSCGGLLDAFMPLDEQGRPTLARGGLDALLIDIGVLQG